MMEAMVEDTSHASMEASQRPARRSLATRPQWRSTAVEDGVVERLSAWVQCTPNPWLGKKRMVKCREEHRHEEVDAALLVRGHRVHIPPPASVQNRGSSCRRSRRSIAPRRIPERGVSHGIDIR
uniref:Uncharacterized protein n=1 Tax=Arundo donax TaxID=35708 RepID=A0A0A9DLN4_ARUDO